MTSTRIDGACTALLVVLMAAILAGCAAVQPTQPSANILLLGEVHDNPLGHQQRFDHLRQRVESGWRPAIVMEQFDRENQAALTQAQATCADAQCVIAAAGGKRWEWPYYEPIIALALHYHLPLVAGNVSRADAAIAMKQGLPTAARADTQVLAYVEQGEPMEPAAYDKTTTVAAHPRPDPCLAFSTPPMPPASASWSPSTQSKE